MSTQQILRRGDDAAHAAFTGAAGEVTYNTTRKGLVIHDAARAGGWPIPHFSEAQKLTFTAADATGVAAGAIVITLLVAPPALTNYLTVSFKADANNAGSCTANVNGTGAVTLKKMTPAGLANLQAADLVTGGIYTITYNGTYWVLQGGPGGLSAVSQGNINTSTGSISQAGTSPARTTYENLILPGGEYGFYPQLRNNTLLAGSGVPQVQFFGPQSGNASFTSFASYMAFLNPGGPAITVYAQQRYVTSSPPFDLGDGDVEGFFFALLNSAGGIESHYFADVPPWAYNGPTNITAQYIDPETGKKYRQVLAPQTLEQILDGEPQAYEMQEITMSLKNADMALIPHPFVGSDLTDKSVVLLDPMDPMIGRLLNYQNAGGGEELANAIQEGRLRIDNECLGQCSPEGVTVHRLQF